MGVALFLAATFWVYLGVVESAQTQDERTARNASDLAADSALNRIERYTRLATALAASAQYASPQDAELDDTRLRQMSGRRAKTRTARDSIESWLPAASGPPSPLATMPDSPIDVWQLFRGLPLRAVSGQRLAPQRRELAAVVMAADPEIVHIAELDALRRVVFLAPFTSQTQLNAFDLSDIFKAGESGGSPVTFTFHKSLLPQDDPHHLTFLSPLRGGRETGYVLVTIGRQTRPTGASSDQAYGVFTASGTLVMYQGDRPPSPEATAPARLVTRRPFAIGTESCTLVVSVPRTNPSVSRIAIPILIFVLSCLSFSVVSQRLLGWVDSYQARLLSVQRKFERRASALAHDFQNRILALRTLTQSVSTKLDLGQIRRLEGILTDLSGYTEHLSKTLAIDAVGLSDLPRHAPTPERAAATYLRGILENVAKTQAGGLGREIPIRFDRAFGSVEPFVAIERSALTRIASNLLGNAIDACKEAGTNGVAIEVAPDDGNVLIHVVDDGCGIDETTRRRLFEPGVSTKGDGHGKGIGLNTSRGLAQAAGGDVRVVSSQRGQGTVMELRLPLSVMPDWFCATIKITGHSVLVVVDDEDDAFTYWTKLIAERLHGMNLPSDQSPRLISLDGPSALRSNPDALNNGTLFLIDHTFKGEGTTGLQLIEELSLQDKAVLVTNYFEQSPITDGAIRLGVQVLPKEYMLNARLRLEFRGAE